jgi:AcrR family transcriptional regulator
MTGRRGKRESRRQQILAAAAAAFAAKGFHGAGIAEIAAAAGIAPANLYRYFAAKEDMVRAIVEAQRAEIAALLAAHLVPETRPAVTALLDFLMAVTEQDTVPRMRALWLEILAEAARHAGIAAMLRADDAQLMASFRALIARGVGKGEIAGEIDVDALARLLIALIDGAMARAGFDPGFAPAAFRHETEMLLRRMIAP